MCEVCDESLGITQAKRDQDYARLKQIEQRLKKRKEVSLKNIKTLSRPENKLYLKSRDMEDFLCKELQKILEKN